MARAPRTVIKEMGMSAADFRRGLPKVLGPDAVRLQPDGAEISSADGGRLVVVFRARAPRLIGGLSLPVAEVALQFEGFPDRAAEDAVLKRFDRAYQRGGG